MRVGLHLQAMHPGEIGGLELYVRALIEHLPKLAPELKLVLVGSAENLPTFADTKAIEKVELTHEQFARLNQEEISSWGLDLWFCPLLTLEPVEPGLPSVVTIPDLQHERYPELFSPDILAWRHLNYARTLKRAERVLTLSEHARGQILNRFAVEPERILAIPLDAGPGLAPEQASDPAYLAAVADRYELPKRFFYYPSNTWPHKSHRRLFEALSLLRKDQSHIELVLTGSRVGGDLNLDDTELVSAVHFLGHIPRQDLAGIYAASIGLVFPSLFEGFGIPLVEAMRIGCPVAASSATSLPEVGGDAILYFDPQNPADIASKMQQLCLDQDLRDELVAAGRHRARRFSWSETARATLGAFREAIESAGGAPFAISRLPTFSVIIPSFQHAEFLPRTLDSLLSQGYPELQIIVIDGGSSDGSLEILEGYRNRHPEIIEFVSEGDRGQAHAVNKGLARARGEIIGWLNSDDTYAPGALIAVGRELASKVDRKVLYGRADYIDTEDRRLGPYPVRASFDWGALAHECFLCQPAVFWRRELVEEGFHLNEDLQMCMDYDLWIRMGRQYEFYFLDRTLARSRIYSENKTLGQRPQVFAEILHVVRHHYGRVPYSWALGQATHSLSDRGELDLKPTWRAVILALATLLRQNLRRPHQWPALRREVMNAFSRKHRASLRGSEIRVPASWNAVSVTARVKRESSRDAKVFDQATGRTVGRIALARPGQVEAIIGLPRQGVRCVHRLRLGPGFEDLEGLEIARFDRLPERGPMILPGHWVLPSSWRSIEVSIELGELPAGGVHLVFLHEHGEIDRWSFPRAGSFRRCLHLPERATDLDVQCELCDPSGNDPVPPEILLLEMQEGRA